MKNLHRKVISAAVALLIPSGKIVQAIAGEVNAKQRVQEETKSQFQKDDCVGKFKKTHENCLPVHTPRERIEIRRTGEILYGQSQRYLGRLEWRGFEANSSELDQVLLREIGVYGCTSIYCRPVDVPGGTALWMSFLPHAESREPILDLLFSKEGQS